MNRLLIGILVGIAVGLSVSWGVSAVLHNEEPSKIDPAKVADYVHAVIEASRTIYATDVVDKLHDKGIVEAAEHWKQENAVPLPAQFLIETGRLIAQKGNGVRYRLVSLWPIYVWNAPSTEFERKGLESVMRTPEQPYTGFTRIGHDRVFQAVYADLAVAHTCVDCHNTHPNSPRRDFKLNDVMGGIVITIPVEK